MLEHLHGVMTPTDDGGDLGTLESGKPELDHLSLVLIQVRHRASQHCRFIVAEDVFFRGWRVVCNVIGGVQFTHGRRACGAAVEIDHGVVSNREEPRAKRAALIGRETGKRPEQNRCCRILGVGDCLSASGSSAESPGCTGQRIEKAACRSACATNPSSSRSAMGTGDGCPAPGVGRVSVTA